MTTYQDYEDFTGHKLTDDEKLAMNTSKSLNELLDYLQKKDYLLQQNELLPDRIKAKAAIVEAVEGLIYEPTKNMPTTYARIMQAIKEWQ